MPSDSSNKQYFHRKHPGLVLGGFAFVLLFFFLAGVEIVLQQFFTPGSLSPFFKLVDEVEMKGDFLTDSLGFLIANPTYFDDFKDADINRHGFRSADFDSLPSNKPRVMFIGDSFTWGHSAKPLSRSFVDLYAKETGLPCINLGIPGTDPAQYAALAEYWVPRLKPQLVFTVLYLGNDLANGNREVSASQPILYSTNAGMLSGTSPLDGKNFASEQEAYNYYKEHFSIDESKVGVLSGVLGKTVIGSWIYLALFKFSDRQNGLFYPFQHDSGPEVRAQLGRIEEVCRENAARFLLIVIPERNQLENNPNEKFSFILKDRVAHYPWDLNVYDYKPGWNEHLSNRGHRKYSIILQNLTHQTINLPDNEKNSSPAFRFPSATGQR